MGAGAFADQAGLERIWRTKISLYVGGDFAYNLPPRILLVADVYPRPAVVRRQLSESPSIANYVTGAKP